MSRSLPKPAWSVLAEELFHDNALVSMTLSGPVPGAAEEARKVVVRPILLKDRRLFQFERHFERKVTHRNLDEAGALKEIHALSGSVFRQADIRTVSTDIAVRWKANGDPVIRSTASSRPPADLRHDREKRLLLPEGEPVDFLVRLGVMTDDGRVIATSRDKFRQVNRFLEMVEDVSDALPAEGPLRVVDLGCGKSILTFALHHFLRSRKGRRVETIGIEARVELVELCRSVSEEMGGGGPSFCAATIREFREIDRVDLVVALHACDTATDDALAKAVAWGASVILSAPCCQHELRDRIKNEVMGPLLRHGLLRERQAALITDAIRGLALEVMGYRVQMLEFIDPEHTPKNLLLRAVRRKDGVRWEAAMEYRRFLNSWGIERPVIEAAMGEEFQRRLSRHESAGNGCLIGEANHGGAGEEPITGTGRNR